MMQTVAERYQKPLPVEIVSKLELSRRQAERLVKREIKCPNCGQTLCKLEYGKVEIKCTRCKNIITITKTTDIKTTEPRATP